MSTEDPRAAAARQADGPDAAAAGRSSQSLGAGPADPILLRAAVPGDGARPWFRVSEYPSIELLARVLAGLRRLAE